MDVVKFEPINSWIAGTVGTIVYTLPATISPSSWHWIAFFRVNTQLMFLTKPFVILIYIFYFFVQEQYSSLGEYVSYVWSPRQPLSGRPRSYQVNVPENSLRVPGKYFAAYMSDTQPYHVMGISPIFEVTRS